MRIIRQICCLVFIAVFSFLASGCATVIGAVSGPVTFTSQCSADAFRRNEPALGVGTIILGPIIGFFGGLAKGFATDVKGFAGGNINGDYHDLFHPC